MKNLWNLLKEKHTHDDDTLSNKKTVNGGYSYDLILQRLDFISIRLTNYKHKHCKLPKFFDDKVLDKSYFIKDNIKIFSMDEVMESKNICDVFLDNIIPFADLLDNKYIVYILDEQKWAKYDAIHNYIFDKDFDVEKFLEK